MTRTKEAARGLILSLAALAVARGQAPPVRWVKSVAPDAAISLYQPEGWVAAHGRNNVVLSHAATGEEMIIVRLPRDPNKDMRAYVDVMVRSFQQSLGGFEISNLTEGQGTIGFALSYTSDGRNRTGVGVVVLKGQAAWWITYVSVSAADLSKGATILAGVAGSITDGNGATLAPAFPGGGVAQPAPVAGGGGGNWLVGSWSTTAYYGELVNPANGTFVQSAHSGQWYKFNPDGTYQFTHVASGQIITGAVITKGTYDVSGPLLRLHQRTESWYPMQNNNYRTQKFVDKPTPRESVLQIGVRGPGEITLQEGNSMKDTFRRGPQ